MVFIELDTALVLELLPSRKLCDTESYETVEKENDDNQLIFQYLLPSHFKPI